MSGFLVDANVLLDIATADGVWMPWSQGQLAAAAGRGAVFINPIIYAELAPRRGKVAIAQSSSHARCDCGEVALPHASSSASPPPCPS